MNTLFMKSKQTHIFILSTLKKLVGLLCLACLSVGHNFSVHHTFLCLL